jgi:hypothetical protein
MKEVTLNGTEPKVLVTFQLPVSLQERLQAEAERRTTPVRRVTVSEVLRDLIDKGC